MDLGDSSGGEEAKKPRPLPADLPRSLNDRRNVPVELVPETEMYDGWQGVYSQPTKSPEFLPTNE
jgi:hypothetical protein